MYSIVERGYYKSTASTFSIGLDFTKAAWYAGLPVLNRPRVERFRLVQVEPLEDVVGKIGRGGGAVGHSNELLVCRQLSSSPARANLAVAPPIAVTGTLSFKNVPGDLSIFAFVDL